MSNIYDVTFKHIHRSQNEIQAALSITSEVRFSVKADSFSEAVAATNHLIQERGENSVSATRRPQQDDQL